MLAQCPVCLTRPRDPAVHRRTASHHDALMKDYYARNGDRLYRDLAKKVIAAGRARMFTRDKTEFGQVVRETVDSLASNGS